MRRFRRIVATAVLGVVASALVAGPAAASKHWMNPDGYANDRNGFMGTRVTSEVPTPDWFPYH